MSTPPLLSIREKARRKSLHRRTDSGELDVFQAESYFSTASISQTTTITIPQRIGVMRQCTRASIDIIPPTPLLNPQRQNNIKEDNNNNNNNNKKKHKQQPNSPGGKLASFFNSLINQTVSKNKKHSKPAPQDATPVSKSDYGVMSVRSGSGFRTPPPYTVKNPNLDWLDQEFKFATSSVKEMGNHEGSFKTFMEDEDGDDSDSSTDLFELQLNYDHKNLHHKLEYRASDLPVYGTTRMNAIKISCATPIKSGALRK